MNCLQGIQDGMFLYEYNGMNEKIDIKKSAELWWDIGCLMKDSIDIQ